MAWRVGRKVPINVYDGFGKLACKCQNAEYAAIIVDAVNAEGVRMLGSAFRHPATIVPGPKKGPLSKLYKDPNFKREYAKEMLDCKGVEPGSRKGKVSLRKG